MRLDGGGRDIAHPRQRPMQLMNGSHRSGPREKPEILYSLTKIGILEVPFLELSTKKQVFGDTKNDRHGRFEPANTVFAHRAFAESCDYFGDTKKGSP
jgi:hypothetical protein